MNMKLLTWSYFYKTLLVGIVLGSCVLPGFAISRDDFPHQPPTYEPNKPLTITIPAAGVQRARVLVAGRNGIRSFEMTRAGEQFSALLSFGELALLKYEIQLQQTSGELVLSPYYSVRQPYNREVEEEIFKLTTESNNLVTRVRQLENAISSLELADHFCFVGAAHAAVEVGGRKA